VIVELNDVVIKCKRFGGRPPHTPSSGNKGLVRCACALCLPARAATCCCGQGWQRRRRDVLASSSAAAVAPWRGEARGGRKRADGGSLGACNDEWKVRARLGGKRQACTTHEEIGGSESGYGAHASVDNGAEPERAHQRGRRLLYLSADGWLTRVGGVDGRSIYLDATRDDPVYTYMVRAHACMYPTTQLLQWRHTVHRACILGIGPMVSDIVASARTADQSLSNHTRDGIPPQRSPHVGFKFNTDTTRPK
jgi:hypothetical protein